MRSPSWLQRLEKFGALLEDILLVAILSAMILIAGSQIILRDVFDRGLIWGDGLLRIMVLWIAVGGGLAASRAEKHLSIGVLGHLLSAKWKLRSGIITNLFTAFICALLCWFSIQFVRSTRTFGDVVLNQVPAWYLQLVLPVGFGLISWRYLVHAIHKLLALKRGPEAE
ncbi:MAG: TRAP transporter small permease subunit [Lysobacterales bacterium]|jgi:TRAP-type C4-dicarboxylate transport system permease small subunit